MSRSSSAILVIMCRLLCILLVFFGSCSPEVDSQREPVAAVPSTTPDTFTIPSVTGSMILDGELDDEIWQDARKLALENRKIQPFGFGKGGESRIAVRGDHLLLSARLPESGRLVSFSTGINPVWWSEDIVGHLPQDVVVPGILEIADLSDLVASLAPRPVLLQELVSGLNKKVSLSDMEREYGAATSRLELRDQRGDSSLTHWLSRECQTN